MKVMRGALFSALLASRLLSAATWHITDPTDFDTAPFRSAIAQANSAAESNIIYLHFSGPVQLYTGFPPLTGNLTILGSQTAPPIISLTDTQPVFQVISGSLTLSNIAFSGCVITNAPVIFNRATLSISNCSFEGNISYTKTNFGGVVFSDGLLSLDHSRFASNSVLGLDGQTPFSPWAGDAQGAALHLRGGISQINNTDFSSNLSRAGSGGFFVGGGRAFGGLSAGGAIFAESAQFNAKNCSFSGNSAIGNVPGGTTQGGALYLSNCVAAIDQCTFSSNKAHGSDGASDPFNRNGYGAGDAAGSAIFDYFSQTRIVSCEFTGNSAIPGTNGYYYPYPQARGALMVIGTPAQVSASSFMSNSAAAARDIAGPMISGGSNTVEVPGGSCCFTATDNMPDPQLFTANPRFEWIKPSTNAFQTLALLTTSSGEVYEVHTEPALPDANETYLSKFDRFGTRLWSDKLGVKFPASNLPGIAEENGTITVYFGSYFGNVITVRSPNGAYTTSQLYPGSIVVDQVIVDGSTSYRLLEQASQLRAEKVDPVGVFAVQLPPSSSTVWWYGCVIDEQRNWYLSGHIDKDTQWAGQPLPKDFIIKFKSDNSTEWVIPNPVNGNIYKMSGGILVSEFSHFVFIDSAGQAIWTKTLPWRPDIPLSYSIIQPDITNARIYVLTSAILPQFERSQLPLESYSNEYLLYRFSGEMQLDWAVHLFGRCRPNALELDSHGSILLAGSMIYSGFTFQNQQVLQTSTFTSFLAKLSADASGLPRLYTAQLPNQQLELFWPTNNVVLQHTASLGSSATWSNLTSEPAGPYYSRTTTATTNRTDFFRLAPAN